MGRAAPPPPPRGPPSRQPRRGTAAPRLLQQMAGAQRRKSSARGAPALLRASGPACRAPRPRRALSARPLPGRLGPQVRGDLGEKVLGKLGLFLPFFNPPPNNNKQLGFS